MTSDDQADENLTSLTLLQRVRQSDEAAWQRFVELYSPLVRHWVKVCGIADANAADLVQEVWKSVATSIAGFHRDAESGTFRGWLWTITRNKARDFHRRNPAVIEATGGTEALRLIEAVPDVEPIDSSDSVGQELVQRALELVRPEFEEHTWGAFERVVLDGWSAAQAAEEFNMKPNAVHQARFRVLRRLKLELAGLESIDFVSQKQEPG